MFVRHRSVIANVKVMRDVTRESMRQCLDHVVIKVAVAVADRGGQLVWFRDRIPPPFPLPRRHWFLVLFDLQGSRNLSPVEANVERI